MGDDSVGVTSLPMTVAARRNARLRAAALATIPLWLFILAALPRVWAPDLVPFGEPQAAYVAEAARRAPVSLADAYGDLTVPTLALVEPLLRELPAPIMVWVVLRGLLDAVGVGLLYLATRPLLGIVPAGLAALLYAASPIAWGAARDPAGPLAPVVMAAALLAAVRLVERPTLVRGAIFGILLGLLARSVPVGIIVAVAGAATLAIGRASWKVGGVTALGLVITAGPALFTNLYGLAHVLLAPIASARTIGDDVWSASRTIVGLQILGARTSTVSPMVGAVVTAGVLAMLIAIRARARHRLLRWASMIGLSYLLVVGCAVLALAVRADTEAEQHRRIFAFRPPDSADADASTGRSLGNLAATPSLREVKALADALLETTRRIGANEIMVPVDRTTGAIRAHPEAPFLGSIGVRSIEGPAVAVLPLERETVLLLSGDDGPSDPIAFPSELRRPSSSTGVFTHSRADTGAHIVTFRPRTVADWLSGALAVSDGRFADGTVLLGVKRQPGSDGQTDLALYWRLPLSASNGDLGARFRVSPAESPRGQAGSAPLLTPEARRSGEIVVQAVRLGPANTVGNSNSLQVTLYDDQGTVVRTASGAINLEVPLGSAAR